MKIKNVENWWHVVVSKIQVESRCMCLPSYPDINTNPKLIPSISITTEISKLITSDINKIIFSKYLIREGLSLFLCIKEIHSECDTTIYN